MIKHQLLAVLVELDFFVVSAAVPAAGGLASFVISHLDRLGCLVNLGEVEHAGQARLTQSALLASQVKLGLLLPAETDGAAGL